MSYGAVVQASIDEKARRVREQREADRRREDRYARAYETCRTRLPDVHDGREGRPCPWAVWALLDLWRTRGEGNVTPAMVRRERNRRLAGSEQEVAA